MTLVATPGAADANSYVAEADAVAFFAGELNTSAWDAANTATREKALRAATTMLDRLPFVGARESVTQALAWPRSVGWLDEQLVAPGAMPPRLVRATCRLALALLTESPTTVLDAQTIVREKVGPIETEYAAAGASTIRVGLDRYPLVLAELSGLVDGAMLGQFRVVRA